MNISKGRTISFMFLSALILMFQNCSQDNRFSSLSSDGLQAAKSDVPATDSVAGGGSVPGSGGTDATAGDIIPGNGDDIPPQQSWSCADGTRGVSVLSNANPNITSPDKVCLDAHDRKKMCDAALASLSTLPTLADGASVENLSGINYFKVSHVKSVRNISGILVLVGVTADANVDEIISTSGIKLLCDVSATHIQNTSGITWVFNGDVGSVENGSGILLVINGTIGSLSNVSGIVTSTTLPTPSIVPSSIASP